GSCPDQRTRSRTLAAQACSWPLLSIGNEPCLLPCQSLNGVQRSRRSCWHIAKNHARHHGAAKGAQGCPQGKHHIHPTKNQADTHHSTSQHAQATACNRQQNRLGEKLAHDVTLPCTCCHAYANFPCTFTHRHQHHIHDPDAAYHQRHGGNQAQHHAHGLTRGRFSLQASRCIPD